MNSAQDVAFSPQLIPQGDGSFLIKPGRPLLGRRRLTVKEAAAKAGVSTDTIYRLLDEGLLEGQHPSPRRTLVFEDSLNKHLQLTEDREFWERRREEREVRKSHAGTKRV